MAGSGGRADFLALLFLRAAKKAARTTGKNRVASKILLNNSRFSHSPARRRFKEILLLLAFIFAGLALARPQWGSTETGKSFVGEDIVFVLDCSLSMTTTDVLPSRMQRAKFAMLDFVQKQSHGRVGFAGRVRRGSAFLQCPLTFDTGAFEETLMSLDEEDDSYSRHGHRARALNEAYRAMDKKCAAQNGRARDRWRGSGERPALQRRNGWQRTAWWCSPYRRRHADGTRNPDPQQLPGRWSCCAT